MLRPSETIQKLLLSCPAHFVGEYEAEDVVVTHAWDIDRWGQGERSPLYRTFFILSFTTPALERAAGVVVPNYSPTGDFFCAMMAVLFGKRFDHHGALEMTGSYYVPDMERASELCDAGRPYHGVKLRADYPVALNMGELKRFANLFDNACPDSELHEAFRTAALFYARALRAVGRDPEIAYLHLITACERLAEAAPQATIELEAEVRTALERIERELPGGDRVARLLRHRMRQLKRRFCGLIGSHLDADFFTRTESGGGWEALQANDFPRAAQAAYDLRSRYVHTGALFGSWIKPRYENAERQNGTPIVGDPQMGKILARAPTFVGLERITRLILIKTAGHLGADLPGPGPASIE